MAPAPLFTDLHSHLVPAVDDGSGSAEESRDSLARLRREGVGTVVTTPHLLLPHLTSDAAIDRQLEQHRVAFDRLLGDLEGTPDLPAVGLGQEIWAPDAALLRRVVQLAEAVGHLEAAGVQLKTLNRVRIVGALFGER